MKNDQAREERGLVSTEGEKSNIHVASEAASYFSGWWLHAGRAACSAASPLAARFTPSAGEGCSVVFVRLTRHTTMNAQPPSSLLACSYATALLPSTELACLLIAHAPASSRCYAFGISPLVTLLLSTPFDVHRSLAPPAFLTVYRLE